jgi:hypothetical protein
MDKKTGGKTEFKDFNLAIKDLSIAGNVIKNASFTEASTARRRYKRTSESRIYRLLSLCSRRQMRGLL